MIVRAAAAQDVPEIVRLKAVLMETGWPFPVAVADDAEWVSRCTAVAEQVVGRADHGWFVVDDPDGGLAGCVSVSLELHLPGPRGTGLSAYLGDMVTDPRHQGRGIGRALLERGLDWAREQGADRIELWSTAPGRPLYERYGFEVAGGPFTHMSRLLD